MVFPKLSACHVSNSRDLICVHVLVGQNVLELKNTRSKAALRNGISQVVSMPRDLICVHVLVGQNVQD